MLVFENIIFVFIEFGKEFKEVVEKYGMELFEKVGLVDKVNVKLDSLFGG